MGGTSKRPKSERRGNVSIFSDPLVWSEQAEALYQQGVPRAEQAPEIDANGVVGDTSDSFSASVFSYNNSMSTFSDFSNSLKYATGYPDSYGEEHVLENGTTGNQVGMTPTRSNRNQKAENPQKESDYTTNFETQTIEGKGVDEWNRDERCCGLLRRAFEEDKVFQRLVHSAVCLLIIFAMLAVYIVVSTQLETSAVDDSASGPGSAPSPYAPKPTMVRPAPATTSKPSSQPSAGPSPEPSVRPSVEPTIGPSAGPSAGPSVQGSILPTMVPSTAPTFKVTELLKSVILSASPESSELLDDVSSSQSKALAWMSDSQVKDEFLVDEKIVQRWVLAVLYYSTGGENWKNTEKWMTDFDECEWYSGDDERSACDDEGRLYSLHLRDNNLDGTIPTELSLLSNSLAFLFLNDGKLHGTIPNEFGKMTNLQRFYLQVNELQGTLPTELGVLASLEHLALGRNDFTGTIPSELQELAGLRLLDLSGNQLRGTIPTVVGRMRRLSSIILNRNGLTGTIPSEIGMLERLRNLLLHSNQFEGDMPEQVCMLREEDELEWLTIDCSRMSCDGGCECECA